MSMQVKRGTTTAWTYGEELLDFGDHSVKDKDSVVTYYKNTITLTIGGPSQNIPKGGTTKINGIPILLDSEAEKLFSLDDNVLIAAKAESADPEINIDRAEWGLDICLSATRSATLLSTELPRYESFISHTYAPLNCGHPQLFVRWDSAACDNPYNIIITVSIKKSAEGAKLLPGQIGAEYLETGGTVLKVGPASDEKEGTKWNEIPSYIGQVLPPVMYGTSLPSGEAVEGQLFFLRV